MGTDIILKWIWLAVECKKWERWLCQYCTSEVLLLGIVFYLLWSTGGKKLSMLPLLLILVSVMTAILPQPETFLLFLIESATSCCFLLFSYSLPISLCFSHSPFVNCFPLRLCVCAGGVSPALCGRSSSVTLASCLAWIGIWFYFSLISGPPTSAHFVSYHAGSCKVP